LSCLFPLSGEYDVLHLNFECIKYYQNL
jgi:hypothetical protein